MYVEDLAQELDIGYGTREDSRLVEDEGGEFDTLPRDGSPANTAFSTRYLNNPPKVTDVGLKA